MTENCEKKIQKMYSQARTQDSTQDFWANFPHFWPHFGVRIAGYGPYHRGKIWHNLSTQKKPGFINPELYVPECTKVQEITALIYIDGILG